MKPRLVIRIWQHITQRRRKQLAALTLVMILASLTEVASIGAVLPFLGALMAPERLFEHPMASPIISVLGINTTKQIVFAATAAFIMIALLSAITRLTLLWSQTRIGYGIGADLSIEIYKKTLYQPYPTHVARNSSEVITAISTKTNAAIQYSLLPLIFVISSIVMMAFILAALIAIDPSIAMIAFGGFGSLYIIIMLATKKKLAHDSARVSHEANQVTKALQEGLGGIRDVLLDGTQETYCTIYRNADNALRNSQANIQIIGGSPRFLIESIGMVLIAILAYKLASSESGIDTAIPVLGALAIGAQRILPLMQQVYSNWASIKGSHSSVLDVLELLDQTISDQLKTQKDQFIPFDEKIQLNQISFNYNLGSSQILKNITLTIEKGKRIGIIGPTGSGKSTLIDILMGLLQPTQGSLTIDGIEITEENNREWQRHIAHVPQSIFLADATITENIAFGVPLDKIDHSRVKNAAQQAQIANTIESWPEKFNTYVGERGIRLSGGQRQRIGIARALYKEADVIIFDEATSALDSQTESDVMSALGLINETITIIMVAHRVTTLKDCDQIIELDHGQISRILQSQEIY